MASLDLKLSAVGQESSSCFAPDCSPFGRTPTANWEHPHSFYCPISKQCMHDPVVLSDGHSYERRHILLWLQDHNTSPVSGAVVSENAVFANHALRNAIEEYFQQVFSVHRRAIRKSIAGALPSEQEKLGSHTPFLRTIDALMQCSLLVNADLSTECILRKIMDEAKVLVGAEVASVFLLDRANNELYSTVNSTDGELRIPATKGIAGHVATTGEPLVIHNAYSSDKFDPAMDLKTGFRTRDILCVPVKTKKGEVLGVVQLINKSFIFPVGDSCEASALPTEEEAMPAFNSDDLRFLQVFASQAAIALASAGFSEDEPQQQIRADVTFPDDFTFEEDSDFSSCVSHSGESSENSSEEPLMVARRSRPRLHASFDLADPACKAATATQMLSAAFGTWELDTLTLGQITGNRPLSTLAMYLFEQHGLIKQFDLDQGKLDRFFIEVERGYDDANPYHNRAHAASVVFMMHALLAHGGIATALAHAFGGENIEHNEKLVMMAGLVAAAVHDYEHSGVTNDFLVKTKDKRAILYNDQHVNENHHVAAAFALLSKPRYNFLGSLSGNDFNCFRSLAVNLVLGTDMASSGKLLQSFADKVSGGSPIKCKTEIGEDVAAFRPDKPEEATLLMQIAMKCADLGHLALDWEMHCQWVRLLEAEFFAQGDREKDLGLPVSFLMDREKPGASDSQIGFFNFVVLPLFRTLAHAAPNARPMLEAVEGNYVRWQEVEAAKTQIA